MSMEEEDSEGERIGDKTSKHLKGYLRDFPGGSVVKNLPANAGDTCSSPGPGRSHVPRGN